MSKTIGEKLAGPVNSTDERLFRRLARTDTPLLDRTLIPLTRLANHSKLWIALATLLAAFGGRFGRRAALRGLISVGITSLFANLPAKHVHKRARPSIEVPHPRRLQRVPTSHSFPSGHSASAFAFATGAGIEVPKGKSGLYALATAVGVSRVYTGVHYPSDVLGGALIGTLIGHATTKFWPLAPNEPAQIRPMLTPSLVDPSPTGRGLSIVVNPSSGPALLPSPIGELEKELPDATIIEIKEGVDLADALRSATIDSVAIGVAGGDGSINAGSAVAHADDKPMVVIPAGTLNHLARDLGLSTTADAIRAVKDGQTVAVDVGLIDGKTFLNTASFGSYVDLVDSREKLESKIGKWPAVVVALFKVLRHSEPVEVMLDGKRRSIWMIFIGNCRYQPEGFAPSWRERMDDGLLDIRLVDAKHPGARLRLLWSVITGTLPRCKSYEAWTADRLEVKSLNGPLRLARDGETFDGSKEFVIQKEKKPLAVYVPQSDPKD